MASSSSAPASLGAPPGEKLTRANHLVWKAQILPALRGARLLCFADGTEKAPAEVLQVEKEGKMVEVPNPAYDAWLEKDQQVLSYLLGSLSTELLVQVVGLEHAADLWEFINTTFASRSKANVSHLRGALSNTKKLNMSADEFVGKMQGFATELIAAGRTIEDGELVDHILNGLDEDYEALVENINGRDTPIQPCELYARLLNTEQRRLKLGPEDFSDPSVNVASRCGGRPQQPPRPSGGVPLQN
jgi:hypothetical protein